MRDAGYTPVKRFEKPLYKENKDGTFEVYKQEIEFVGKIYNNDWQTVME